MSGLDERQPASEPPEPPVPSVRSRLVAVLPFAVTALVAVLLSLAIQWLLFAPLSLHAPMPTPVALNTPLPAATPPALTPAPAPAPLPDLPENLLRLAILDLEDQNRRLRSDLYLLRAVAQLDDALVALQANQLDEVDRSILMVYRSLDQAYAFSAEQDKGPLDTFRLQLSQIRDDLHLRPEGADRRLRQLRALMLSLVEA
ncbi:hypothetical protein [Candidatus Viridilinea mediisalina]|nr:hypothetical protein [Candidatus Viridilinea mediisalina]